MQIMRNFLFLVLVLSQFFVGAQEKKQKTDEEIAYEVINFHFQDSDTIKLFNKTMNNDHGTIFYVFKENELPPFNYYEKLSSFHKPFLFQGSPEIDSLLRINEKELFNKYFSKLSKVKLNKKKLNNNIILFPVKKWSHGYEHITFPFHIESNGVLYSFFMQNLSGGGGDFFIYTFKNDEWEQLFNIPLYYE